MSSIAHKYRILPETIWDDPANAKLKDQRKDPNILYPGDVVYVPDKEEREEACATEQRHRFRRKGVPVFLRLRLLDDERHPRQDIDYILKIDGDIRSGKTDVNGCIDEPIPPNARRAILTLSGEEQGDDPEEYVLSLGSIDPIFTSSGAQQRLANLGYDVGSNDAENDEFLREAIKGFQKEIDQEETGELNDATLQELKDLHTS
jgi:N-acetylmuramoyl-L-alanine amidase